MALTGKRAERNEASLEYILAHLEVWGIAAANLFLGGALAFMAVAGYVKEERFSCAEMILRLSAGTALMAIGLLLLMGISPKWLAWSSWSMALGILFIMESTGILSASLTGGMAKRLSVLCGIGLIVSALAEALILHRY